MGKDAPELWQKFLDGQPCASTGRHVIDRCNLTITRLPDYSDLPEFLAAHQLEVIASLPSFAGRQTDAQRGDGGFEDSIAALHPVGRLGRHALRL